MPPRRPTRTLNGWDSAGIPSPCTAYVHWPALRWSAATSTPQRDSPSGRSRYPSGDGLPSNLRRCSTGRRSGPPAGQVHEALATVEAARPVLAGTRSPLLARADELEGLLRLSLGDLRSPAELARTLAAAPRSLLLAKIALASGDHHTAQ